MWQHDGGGVYRLLLVAGSRSPVARQGAAAHLPGVRRRHSGELLRVEGGLPQLDLTKVHVVDGEHLAGGGTGEAGFASSHVQHAIGRALKTASLACRPRTAAALQQAGLQSCRLLIVGASQAGQRWRACSPRAASTGHSGGSWSSRFVPRRQCSSRGSAECQAAGRCGSRTRGRPAGAAGRQVAGGRWCDARC